MAKDNFSEYFKSPIATNVVSGILTATNMKPFAKQTVEWLDTQLCKGDIKKVAIKLADKLIELAREIIRESEKLS